MLSPMRKSRKRAFNAQKEITRISYFIRKQIGNSHTKGVVIGISGGIDSAVVASLCRKALGSSKVLGVFLFEDRSRKSQDFSDAKLLAKNLGIKSLDLCITPVVDSFLKLLKSNDCRVSRLTLANIKARTRMVLLYALANQRNLLVAGTGDRSESLVGYFCYDSKTRVVTPDGPKYYWELEPSSTVFSINLETGKMEERLVNSVHVFDYNGWMINLDNEHVDLMVTPNHRILVSRNHGEGPLAYRTAEGILSSNYVSIPLPLPWDGSTQTPDEINLGTFLPGKLSSNANQPFPMRTPDFLYLMGLFIGDGTLGTQRITAAVESKLTREEYFSSHRDNLGRFTMLENPIAIEETYEGPKIFIASTEAKRSRKPLTELLSNYKIHYSSTSTIVAFSNRALSLAFTDCGHGARNKMIPSWIMRFPASALLHLYKGLMDSDGNANGRGYTTTSLRLAYQVVELCAKLGIYACVKWRPPRKTTYRGKELCC